jgi:hypothetical protein
MTIGVGALIMIFGSSPPAKPKRTGLAIKPTVKASRQAKSPGLRFQRPPTIPLIRQFAHYSPTAGLQKVQSTHRRWRLRRV